MRTRRPVRPLNLDRTTRVLADLHEELYGAARADLVIVRHLLINLLRESSPARANSGRLADARPSPAEGFVRAREVIESRYDEPLGLADLARHAGMSAQHFCTEFRRNCETPQIALLIQRRLAAAMALLVGTDLPVGELGARVVCAAPLPFL